MQNFTFPPKATQNAHAQATSAPTARSIRKSRSHSRSESISSQIIPPTPTESITPPATRSRPNSSHKRNSSVSNRRESAELMGLPPPPEDPVTKDMDPVRRALLALEGKNATSSPRNSFGNRIAQVQIPDFDAVQRSDLAEPRRLPLALNSSLAGKRDSFGKLLAPASSAKMELGTLLEEEEEEEDEYVQPMPVVTPPPKPRPQTLNLRSLSVATALPPSNLPTPVATPSPRVPGLKSLTLASNPVIRGSSPLSGSRASATSPPPLSRSPLGRKSSISYKKSDAPRSPPPQIAHHRLLLLTPDATPTSASPPATPNMSPSRRTFIYQSHSALVSRVSELERLLAAQSPSVTAPSPVTPANDEFLALIADLKAERDELRRDAETSKAKIAELEKHTGTLTTRIETERREAWVVREQLGVLQIEKGAIEKDCDSHKKIADQLNAQVDALQRELEQMRRERDQAFRELAQRSRPTVKYAGSIDSLGSTTDVDELSSHRSSLATGLSFKLKAVVEEEAEYGIDDSAPRFEDDSDDSFYSRSRTNSACSDTLAAAQFPDDSSDRTRSPSPPAHARRSSLSRTWNFSAAARAPRNERRPAEIDRFFVCLEDAENVPSADEFDMQDDTLTRPKFSLGFGHGFGGGVDDDDDDMPPFVLPAHPEVVVPEKISIVEEDDDEDASEFKIPAESAKLSQFSVTSSRSITPTPASPSPTVSASHPEQASTTSIAVVESARHRALPLVKKEEISLARPKLTIIVNNAQAEMSRLNASSFQFPKHASSSRSHVIAAPSSSSTTHSTTITTSSRERIRLHRSDSSRNNSSSSSPQAPRSLVPLRPSPFLKTHVSVASQGSGPATPISPFVSRLSSFTSLLLSPLADVNRDPVKVSRETQLERLRAELSGQRRATTWLPPDSCGKCAHCSSSGTIEL